MPIWISASAFVSRLSYVMKRFMTVPTCACFPVGDGLARCSAADTEAIAWHICGTARLCSAPASDLQDPHWAPICMDKVREGLTDVGAMW